MNLGRGFHVPREKGVMQNGGNWVPSTPDKPIVLQMSNNVESETPRNQMGEENWMDLLGIYSDVLQNEVSNAVANEVSNALPQEFDLHSPNNVQGVAPVETYNTLQRSNRDFAPPEVYNRPPHNFGGAGVNRVDHRHNFEDVSTMNKFGSSNQNPGEVVLPQKVHSLAELMGMRRAPCAPTSYGAPNGSNYVVGNHVNYAVGGANLQQNPALHARCNGGGYNLQEMPNGRLSVPNLNLPASSEIGESSSALRPFPLEPATPDQQKQTKNCQIIQVPDLSIGETSVQDKQHKQDKVILSPQPEIIEIEDNEILVNNTVVGSSTAATQNLQEENTIIQGGDGGIDQNKTPQQKTPKRRKHRPKVIKEKKKPKNTPKPEVAKTAATPDGNTPAKRKYVRKSVTKTSTDQLSDAGNIGQASNLEPPAEKSCKRKLNFDLGNGTENENQQVQNNEGNKLPFNLNLDSQEAEWSTELNGPPMLVVNEGQQNTFDRERQQTQPSYNSVHSANNISLQGSTQMANTSPMPTSKNHLNLLARNFNVRMANTHPNIDGYNNQIHHQISGGGPAQLVIRPDFDDRRQSTVQSMPQLLENPVDVTEKQGSRNPHAITLMGSQLWLNGVSDRGYRNCETSNSLQNGLMHQKKKVESTFHGTSSSTPSGISIEDVWGPTESRGNMSSPAQISRMHQNGGLTNADHRGQIVSRNTNNDRSNMLAYHYYMNMMHMLQRQQQHALSQERLRSEQIAPQTSHYSANKQITNSVTAMTNWNPKSTSERDPKPIPMNGTITTPDRVAAKRPPAGQTSSKKILQESKKSRSKGYSPKKFAGPVQEKERRVFSINDITDLMQDLSINNNGKKIVRKEQNALVPYRGSGTVVPYVEFDVVKRRKPRPRVDLDPETNRLWNLLMGKEGDETAETMDNNKEKWWEEERKMFRGRVDSFIARMHLVQGDRRFSKWKGSVVDSVIGVFLTQNVSDHLSSSAFMSLAAKFPLKSTSTEQTYCGNGGRPVKHHEVRVTHPDETTCDNNIVREPVCNSSVTSIESSEYRENDMKGKGAFSMNDQTRRTEEDIISSQSSSESFVFQACEDFRSSSGSNSEAEEGLNFNKNLDHVSVTEQAERISALQQDQFRIMGSLFPNKRPFIGNQPLENTTYSQNPGPVRGKNAYHNPLTSTVPSNNSGPNRSMGLEKWEADVLGLSGKESMSSLASTDFEIPNRTGVECGHNHIGQSATNSLTSIQNGRPEFQPAVNHSIPNKHFEFRTDFSNGSQNGYGQQPIKNMRGKQDSFQQESTSQTNPTRPAEASSKQPNDNWKHGDNTIPEPTEIRQVRSSDELSSKISTTAPNARKRKSEKEKPEPFNWDTLRKEVLLKNGTREKSRDAMDSLDYEALRTADVKQISDAIKERGMNNMLAERMKAFLNRLVEDHERVDLEWLRDVQPDKAKDYLLSVRGLGLKSVECVRLLTLHHLAFPVDTNVGRIAVRLGWVPLQPLPESLQLHLLELYPVLESIQKYLWPRLCKLDQETLYELHYQMITFGKVFCTKREPNCNACPMRAECRHFASAFASARLALPGLEEKQIVSSATPVYTNKSSNVTIKPMQLLTCEDNVESGMGSTRNCEPFIEEPTSPEPPMEVSDRDIEDAFYEDPDEIPVIKLNVEEFTTNLQSFMQEQMEMGESDMSKALVALNPELASIPIPKLKHISRLRTEHQVYELPDSHPLLKAMDRREADDPSPYLLAIWTPGETADSVQPPEGKCSYQENGVCKNPTCFSCSSTREAESQTVRGTILIPCRTAMRGSFPLNGTYFQVNEVFADHESSLEPIDVPRRLLWNLPRRTVFFGTSVTSIFKGLSTEGIQYCFWRGFVCVRGFDQKHRAPRPLKARLHLPASKMMPKKNE
ncbi:hypothetical protein ABFS83_06G087000 [Erythranthe nasuta]